MPYPITVLIDGNNFSIRILTAIPGYNNQFQSSHQINLFLHSFFTGLLTICNKIKQKYHSVDNLVITWDSRINNRKLIYPEYKGNRKPKTLEEAKDKTNHYSLLDKLRESLKTLGDWSDVEIEGYEADDIIAYFVKNSTYDNNFIIVSSDNDFFQLLGDRVIQYLPHRKEFYSLINFKNEFDDIIPEKYIYVKALCGDKGDNIKGINQIGIKKAIKMIKSGQCFTHWINTYKDVDLEMNVELIRLPFEENKINIKLPQSYFDKGSFINLFQTYGLQKLNLSDFKQLLNNKNEIN